MALTSKTNLFYAYTHCAQMQRVR